MEKEFDFCNTPKEIVYHPCPTPFPSSTLYPPPDSSMSSSASSASGEYPVVGSAIKYHNCEFVLRSDESKEGLLQSPSHWYPANTTCHYRLVGNVSMASW